MAYEFVILKNQPNGLNTRWIEAYMRNTPNPEVRRVGVQIGLNDPLNTIDQAAAFAAGVIVPNGTALWNQIDLETTDDVGRGAIRDFFDVVRASGTLAQMIAALEGVIDDDPKQLTAYTRIITALNGGTAAEQRRFMAALAVIVYSKLGQRPR